MSLNVQVGYNCGLHKKTQPHTDSFICNVLKIYSCIQNACNRTTLHVIVVDKLIKHLKKFVQPNTISIPINLFNTKFTYVDRIVIICIYIIMTYILIHAPVFGNTCIILSGT